MCVYFIGDFSESGSAEFPGSYISVWEISEEREEGEKKERELSISAANRSKPPSSRNSLRNSHRHDSPQRARPRQKAPPPLDRG